MCDATFTTERRRRRARLRDAHLYLLVTAAAARGDWLAATEHALAGGVDVVQLREKSLCAAALLERAAVVGALCRAHGALFIVNDRLDVAAGVDCDGVHVGQGDASVASARRALGPHALVGVSTHDAAELDRTLAAGADYVGVGSVYATATKGRAVPVGSPAGLAPLAARAEAAGVPAFAIGGIDVDRARAVAAAGFTRIAVCAAVLGAPDPTATARTLRGTAATQGSRRNEFLGPRASEAV